MFTQLQTVAWIACIVYSTIPAFWLAIHPRAEYWRSRRRSPYRILLPLWIGLWAIVGSATAPWRRLLLYESNHTWIPATALLCAGVLLYKFAHRKFSLTQLGGLPELLPNHSQQGLITTGIRARVRHPVYLGHLLEMLGWSLGTGLAVCWALTALAVLTGAIMIQMEDRELQNRFGEPYRRYRSTVPSVLPRIWAKDVSRSN